MDIKTFSPNVLAPVRKALHDLCQPATATLCLLEMARMQGTDTNPADVLSAALVEVERIVASVHEVRKELQKIEEAYA